MDASVEPTEVGLPQEVVPWRQCQGWLGQQEEEVGEPHLLRPEVGDQGHGEIWGLYDYGHYSLDEMEGRERLPVEGVPRAAAGILEDGLWTWDEGAV